MKLKHEKTRRAARRRANDRARCQEAWRMVRMVDGARCTVDEEGKEVKTEKKRERGGSRE